MRRTTLIEVVFGWSPGWVVGGIGDAAEVGEEFE
jgi:hypothetical protein